MASQKKLSKWVRFIRLGIKKGGAALAKSLLGKKSFSVLGIPSGLDSVEGTKSLLYPAEEMWITLPKTEGPLFWKFQQNPIDVKENGFLAVSKGIATHLGGTLTEKGKLITTYLQEIDGKSPSNHNLFNLSSKRFFPKILKTDQPVVNLTSAWSGAFYHWMYEILPRLHLIEKEKVGALYIETVHPFQKESLLLLEIPPSNLILAQSFQGVESPQIMIPSVPSHPTSWTFRYLREQFLPRLKRGIKRRVYISRNDAGKRRVINEEAIENILHKRGFETVVLSRLSLKEQMEVFYGAEAVVGPHGAGFSHLFCCDPNTPILEFFSPAYVHPCYWQIASHGKLPYYYLFGKGEPFPSGYESHLDPDIEVDEKALILTLASMGL